MDKLKALEEKLNLAKEAVKETKLIKKQVKEDMEEIIHEQSVDAQEQYLNRLRTDLEIIRNNLIKLIDYGQNLLRELQTLPAIDLKASQLMAISDLQKTIGQNTKLLWDLYKELSELENMKKRTELREREIEIKEKEIEIKSRQVEGKLNVEKAEKVQNIFVGTTAELLKLLQEAKDKDV